MPSPKRKKKKQAKSKPSSLSKDSIPASTLPADPVAVSNTTLPDKASVPEDSPLEFPSKVGLAASIVSSQPSSLDPQGSSPTRNPLISPTKGNPLSAKPDSNELENLRQGSSPSSKSPSWIEVLKSQNPAELEDGEKFVLPSGEKCITMPDELIQNNLQKWEPFILGQFHGKLPTRGALFAILNGIWSSSKKDITVSRIGPSQVLIKIPDKATRLRVLGQGMWSIGGQSMFVADWSPDLSPVLPKLTKVPVWVEFRGVAPQFYSETGLKRIASLVGKPVKVHPATLSLSDLEVAKVLTIVDPTVELPEAANVQFKYGEINRVLVACPWLPPICLHCKELGHSKRRCPSAPSQCSVCKSSVHSTEDCPKNKQRKKKGMNQAEQHGHEAGSSNAQKVWVPVKKVKELDRTPLQEAIVSIAKQTPKDSEKVVKTSILSNDRISSKGKVIEAVASLSPIPEKGRKCSANPGNKLTRSPELPMLPPKIIQFIRCL